MIIGANKFHRQKSLTLSLLIGMALLASSGCFDANRLIESRRLTAIRAKLQEVDLGEFRVTLPQGDTVDHTTELRFRVFGRVATRQAESVREVIDNFEPQIRDQMLVATRELLPTDIEEPKLKALRETIAEVVNSYLEEDPVQSVGFYSFNYAVF